MNFYSLNRGLYKRLHIYFNYRATKYQYESKVKADIVKFKLPDLSKNQKKQIRDYFGEYGFDMVSTAWHRFYFGMTGRFDVRYIPKDIFYNYIEPSLNMRPMFPALTDKNIYCYLFPDVPQPLTLARNVNGHLINRHNEPIELKQIIDICKDSDSIIIKPSIDSGGGKNILVLERDEFSELDGKLLAFGNNFIIQQFVEQHAKMKELSSASLNTLRIHTLRLDNEIIVFRRLVRFGTGESKIDNTRSGGIYCEVSEEGLLEKHGYDVNLTRHESGNNGLKLEGFKIPNFTKVLDFVRELHKMVLHFDVISWDIGLDRHGDPILIEYNVFGQGVEQFYGPLFGENTDSVLRKCDSKMYWWRGM